MQPIANGPHLPTELLHAHEEGRVVFFCGAGISKPAGLPLFGELVEKVYTALATNRDGKESALEKEAFGKHNYDATLHLLEKRYLGGKASVRQVLPEILATTEYSVNDNHKSLLKLSKTTEGKSRLVTTNYDHLFEYAALANQSNHAIYAAPYVPIPKQSDWSGMVYLHGILPPNISDNLQLKNNTTLNDLVLTSADFGKAYLTERWAARFITELFKRYVICFVGYSLDDPILRYMTDALAADSEDGNSIYHAYAFTGINVDNIEVNKNKAELGWQAKGVTPIIYNDQNNHELLEKTLTAWASSYALGTTGYTQIITQYANIKPVATTQQDDYVSRMLWALSEPSGKAAKAFAEHQPLPAFEWFKELTSPKYFRLKDLPRLQVYGYTLKDSSARQDEKYSLLHHPSSPNHSAWLSLIGQAPTAGLDSVSLNLCNWLTRYLSEPDLLLWAVNKGTQGHKDFHQAIEEALKSTVIPKPMRKLWQLYLLGYMDRDFNQQFTTHIFIDKIRKQGLTFSIKKQLITLLSPKLSLDKIYNWELSKESEESPPAQQKVKNFVNPRVELSGSQLRYFFYSVSADKCCAIAEYLPFLLPVIEASLLETLELMVEVEEAQKGYDRSCFDMPSIEPHWQNRHHHNWTVLIELLRDGAVALAEKKPDAAKTLAEAWFKLPYLSFKRLALSAASKGLVESETWLDWLLNNNGEYLWDHLFRREICRLLATQSGQLTVEQLTRIEKAILLGRITEKEYTKKMTVEQLACADAERVWLRLLKLQEGGASLSCEAVAKLKLLVNTYPENLQAHEYQKEEFNSWTQSSMDPGGFEYWDKAEPPKEIDALIHWVKENNKSDVFGNHYEWEEYCKSYPARSLLALIKVGKENIWPSNYWAQILSVFSKSKFRAKRSWSCISPILNNNLPINGLENIDHSFAWWLAECAKTFTENQPIFYLLLNTLIQDCLNKAEPSSYHENVSINQAINHPLGLATQALMNDIYINKPKDGDGLSEEQKSLLELLINSDKPAAANAKYIVGEHAVSLFRLDQDWAEQHLIPQYNWIESSALHFWKGFLLSPRDNKAFLELIYPYYLETANHYNELNEVAEQYVHFMVYIQLTEPSYFSVNELVDVFSQLPSAALASAAQYLSISLSNSRDPEKYWSEKIKPFYLAYWPKDQSKCSAEVSDNMLRLLLATDKAFPDAYETLKNLLGVHENKYSDLYAVKNSDVCVKYPEQTLELLGKLITAPEGYDPKHLGECLGKIRDAKLKLESNPIYQRLNR